MWIQWAVFIGVVCTATPTLAEGRFGLQIDAGPLLPLSASLHDVVALDVETEAGERAQGTPTLANWWNTVGVRGGIAATVSTVEVAYAFERFAWRERRVECVGDRPAEQLPNGEIADAEVRYECGADEQTHSLRGDDRPALRFHHLNVGPRLYLRPRDRAPVDLVVDEPAQRGRARTARVYGIVSPGLTLALYDDENLGRQTRGGFNVSAGGGVDVRLDRTVSFTFGIRYTASFVGGSSKPSARSGRAIATGRGVAGALMDIYHRVGATVGVRFDFR